MNRSIKPVKTKEVFARELKTSNMNVLAVAILSLVNILMILIQADTYFPFSAAVPVYLVMFFGELCGMRSEEFYEANYGADWKSLEFLSEGLFWAIVAIAVVVAAVYFVLWYLSKKKKVFSTVLMVLYAIDTVALLFFNVAIYEFTFMAIIELVFHAWVFYYLILALKAWDGIEVAPTQKELEAQLRAAYGIPATPVDEFGMPVDTDTTADTTDTTADTTDETVQ